MGLPNPDQSTKSPKALTSTTARLPQCGWLLTRDKCHLVPQRLWPLVVLGLSVLYLYAMEATSPGSGHKRGELGTAEPSRVPSGNHGLEPRPRCPSPAPGQLSLGEHALVSSTRWPLTPSYPTGSAQDASKSTPPTDTRMIQVRPLHQGTGSAVSGEKGMPPPQWVKSQ